MGRRREIEEEHENHERWLVSYADMITLLAALFIVLFAMSRIDLAKFEAFAGELSKGLGGNSTAGAFTNSGTAAVGQGSGVLDGAPGSSTGLSQSQLAAAQQVLSAEAAQGSTADRARMSATRSTLEQALEDAGLEGAVRFRQEARGLVISVATDGVLFESGSASIPPPGVHLLSVLAPRLATLPNALGVEGHTDDRPVTGGGSNWELSTARATAVLRVLVERFGVPAEHVYAAGYADQRPLVANDTDAHRALNRRVEIVVLATDDAPGGGAAGSGTPHDLTTPMTPIAPITPVATDLGPITGPITDPIGDPIGNRITAPVQ